MAKGIILLDYLVGLVFIITITSISLFSYQHLLQFTKLQSLSKTLYQHLKTAQWQSLSTDQNISCQIEHNTLHIQSETETKSVNFSDQQTNLSCNRSYGLGFKSNFMTQYAGTITLEKEPYVVKVSLPVGLSILRWR